MRALVFGGTGMLGQAVASHWRRRQSAVLALSRDHADIADRDRLLYWADAFRPQLIINCAAFTKVDLCEERRDHALRINGTAVASVVAAAASVSARLVHISSDYVFDGRAERPYQENDPTGPMSVYGESKLQGEKEALRYDKSLVLRASWLFGPGGPNFVATIRRLLLEGRLPLRVVDDQVGCPTYTPFLARAIWRLAAMDDATGIWHYRNRDAVSWHGFAKEIAAKVAPNAEVLPVSTEEFPRPAPRPAWSVLDVKTYESATGRRVEPWDLGLEAYLDLLGENS